MKWTFKKYIFLILGIAIWAIIYFFHYPAFFMGTSLPKQPDLSTQEKLYFSQLKEKSQWEEINRMYSNEDSIGNIILNYPLNLSEKYSYYMELSTSNKAFFEAQSEKEARYYASHIRNSICKDTLNLKAIYIAFIYNNENEKLGTNTGYKYYEFPISKKQ